MGDQETSRSYTSASRQTQLAENLSMPGSRAAHRAVASVSSLAQSPPARAHGVQTPTPPLRLGRVDPTLPRAARRSERLEREPVPQLLPAGARAPAVSDSLAASPTPRGGCPRPVPLSNATTCARPGVAFVQRFTAKRPLGPDLTRPPAEKERRSGQDQAEPRARSPAVTWRRSDNFDSPRPTSDSAAAPHGPRRASRGPHSLFVPVPFRLRRLPSFQPDRIRSTLPPIPGGPHPLHPPALSGQLPAREGAPHPGRAIPRRRPRPRPLA